MNHPQPRLWMVLALIGLGLSIAAAKGQTFFEFGPAAIVVLLNERTGAQLLDERTGAPLVSERSKIP